MMYNMKDMIKDMVEFVKFNKTYKQLMKKEDLDLETNFEVEFTWKRCKLADRMNDLNWLLSRAVVHNANLKSDRFWKETRKSSDRLAFVIRRYYKLSRKFLGIMPENIVTIGNGINTRTVPNWVLDD